MSRHPLTPDAAAYIGGLNVPRPILRRSTPPSAGKAMRFRAGQELRAMAWDAAVAIAMGGPIAMGWFVYLTIHH